MLLFFKSLSYFSPHLKHFVSTRKGGVSHVPVDSLNTSFLTNDLPQNVIQNRKIIAQMAQIPLDNWCVPQQTHSSNITCVDPSQRGKGAFSHEDALPNIDGLITAYAQIALVVQSADCVCSLYYDPENQVIGAAHAGWKGTTQYLPQKMIQTMQKEFNSKPENIFVAIAPCISVESYEVGPDVVEIVEKNFPTQFHKLLIWNSQTCKHHFDLPNAHLYQLQQAGVPSQNIEIIPLCTFREKELFFSARREKNQTGRFAVGIMMTKG